jgi:predicted Fe-Mo cluster-binding NifX family protein
MKICIPTTENKGLESAVSAHFGSAPFFMLVDTESGETSVVENANQHHSHGMCRPLAAIEGQQVDGVVVGGIGAGALAKLGAAGIAVYRADHPTVGETLEAFKADRLGRVEPGSACSHGHHGPGPRNGAGCGHH